MHYQFASLTKNRVIIAIQSYFRNRRVPFGYWADSDSVPGMDFFQISGSDSLQNCRFRFGYPVLRYLSPTLDETPLSQGLVFLEACVYNFYKTNKMEDSNSLKSFRRMFQFKFWQRLMAHEKNTRRKMVCIGVISSKLTGRAQKTRYPILGMA